MKEKDSCYTILKFSQLKKSQIMLNHIVNLRNYTALHALDKELTFTTLKNYLFDLDYLTLMSVEGDNASTFLQGQLSCDVREVTGEYMRQGAMCNIKGRILTLLDVLNLESHGFRLLLPQDLYAGAQTSLAKTALLSRVQLSLDSTYKIFGMYAPNPGDLQPFGQFQPLNQYQMKRENNAYYYQIMPCFYILLVKNESADVLKAPFVAHDQYRGSLAWHQLQLQHNRVEIYPDSRGLFLPHRLCLNHSGYIDFEKGCYKGQEIIARMHYRSTQKHTLAHFIVDTHVLMQPGLPLYCDEVDTVIGELIDYCPIAQNRTIISASILTPTLKLKFC